MKITVIIAYMGSWPPWFPLFLKTCEKNSFLEWKIFTDIAPNPSPANVEFIPMTIDEFKALAASKLGIQPRFTQPYKICDFRIAWGKIFEDYLRESEYYGHGDIDILYGDLHKFVGHLFPLKYDVISFAYNKMSGSLCFLKNDPAVITRYQELEKWEEVLSREDNRWVDEYPLSRLFNRRDCFFQDLDPFERFVYKRKRRNYHIQEGLWDDGRMYVTDGTTRIEVPHYHFYMYAHHHLRCRCWDLFSNAVRATPDDKRWRITSVGILPEKRKGSIMDVVSHGGL